jgi:signal transduction histidine kinase
MTYLNNSVRRWFLLAATSMLLIEGAYSQQIILISFALVVIYIFSVEVFQRYKVINFPYDFSLSFVDILFVTWAYFFLNQEFFLLFYCLFIGIGSNRYSKLMSLVLLGESLILICLPVFISMVYPIIDTPLLAWELVVRMGLLIFAFHVGSILGKIKKTNEDSFANLEQRLKAKDSILSTLAHELRTPLAMIKSSSEILLEGRPGEVNKTQINFLNTVRGSTLRLMLLVEDLLAQIKIEATWLNVKLKPLDVRPIVKKVIQNIEPLLNQKHQTIRYSFPKLVPKVLADSNWLQQVFINLIHNASKYTSIHGHIVISIKENEQYLVISISDDGLGIKNKEKERIFAEFYRSDNEFADDAEGIGLGLAIVRHVVKKHNGEVYVGSVPGMGSTFSFTVQKEGEF